MSIFHFKYFQVVQERSAMKVGTDALVLGSLVKIPNNETKVLEVGSGTGVISLILAQRFENAIFDAVEIDEPSFEESRLNFESSKWHNRLNAIHGNFLTIDIDRNYDLIVSNPPYYSSTNESKDDRQARTKHLSSLPLMNFAERCAALLTETGEIWLTFPFTDREHWFAEFEKHELYPNYECMISGKESNPPMRSVVCFSKTISDNQQAQLIIRNSNGNYSNAYKELTSELHDRILD